MWTEVAAQTATARSGAYQSVARHIMNKEGDTQANLKTRHDLGPLSMPQDNRQQIKHPYNNGSLACKSCSSEETPRAKLSDNKVFDNQPMFLSPLSSNLHW